MVIDDLDNRVVPLLVSLERSDKAFSRSAVTFLNASCQLSENVTFGLVLFVGFAILFDDLFTFVYSLYRGIAFQPNSPLQHERTVFVVSMFQTVGIHVDINGLIFLQQHINEFIPYSADEFLRSFII